MFKTLRTVLCAGLAVAASLGVAQAQTKIKYGAYHTANETFIKEITQMMDTITERTDGEVVFEPYYAGSLLKAQDLYPGMSRGAVDMVTSAPQAFNTRDYPLTGVVLPFMSDNPLATTMAFQDWVDANPEVGEEFDRNGAHLLFGWSLGENVLWTKKAVTEASDLEGMRIRMLLGPGEALSILGATAVATPYTEAIDLLQRGGVDGISTTFFDQGVRDGLGDVSDYVSSAGDMGVFAVMLTSIRKPVWEGFDEQTRDIFNEEIALATERYFASLDEAIDGAVDKLAENERIQIGEISADEAARWRELTQDELHSNYNDRAKTVNADGQKLIDDFTARIAEYETQYPYQTGIERFAAQKGE
ncbi:MAG TPA: TRAP transporter substrate-binding protein DctP [Paenalcaligenes sp.]|nr:TRAP transporter substrate-binding protein DctP [Paenalcaligenes sp.]